MEDMPESDLLPKNMMKVPEVFHYIVDHHIEKGRGEEMEKGRKREGGEEIRGRRGGGKGRSGEGGRGGGEEGEGVYIPCIVTMSLCLCSYVKKS